VRACAGSCTTMSFSRDVNAARLVVGAGSVCGWSE
jgi:hypothetical protein